MRAYDAALARAEKAEAAIRQVLAMDEYAERREYLSRPILEDALATVAKPIVSSSHRRK
jgi:hypothetical protein